MTDELERLAKLRDAGALNEEEFAAAKRQVLAAEAAGLSGGLWRRTRQAWTNRFLLVLVVLTLSLIVLATIFVPKFEMIFADMLGGARLPALTIVVLRGQWLFVALGVVFSGAGCVFRKRPRAAEWLFAAVLVLVAWVFLICVGLFLPLIQVIHQMQGPAGP